MGDQPVGVAQLAAADVVGRTGTDRLPVVVPGTQVFEEAAQRAVAVLAAAAAPRASRPGGSRAASGWPPPCGRASPECCTGRAGSGPAGRRRRPGFRDGPIASQFQAGSLVCEPPVALQPDQLGEDHGPQRRRRDRLPAQAGGGGVGQQRRPGLDRALTLRPTVARSVCSVPPRRWSTTLRSQATSSSVRCAGCSACVCAAGASSRCVCALTKPGTIATLPRSRSPGRSLGRPTQAIRPSRSSSSRPRSAAPPPGRHTAPERQRVASHRASPGASP